VVKIKLSELRKLWETQKAEYESKEVGTGVHNFQKKLLESEELFKLKEGSLSTRIEKRKSEFIHERGTRERRQADFVIFIDPEIVIPVEVECYTHIDRGKDQLRNYQKDLEKKYGILTDGYQWLFYNNESVEKEFDLKDILENSELFLSFWHEYIKPIHYYITFFKDELLRKVSELPVESNKAAFFEDTTFLIKNLQNKLQIEGYFSYLKPKEREKEATHIAYAYLIQFILYKTLVDNEFDDFKPEYQRYLRLISDHIVNQKFKDILGIIDGISEKISKNIYRPFRTEQKDISEKIMQIFHQPENNLADISPWLDIFIYIKKYNFSNIQNDIFGYIYENYLKELFSDEERGQYYTDPSVVKFMIEKIGYIPTEIKERIRKNEDNLSIIDPSCGSGTFLYTATDSVVNAFSNDLNSSRIIQDIVTKNIFGLDIEEFPLYLAEMSILMRLLPFIISEKYNNPFDKKIKVFKTVDSIAEFIGTGIDNAVAGQTTLLSFQEPRYKSFMRSKDDIQEMKESLIPHSGIPRLRYDYVIGNPPYVPYNKCSKIGLASFELIKKRELRLNNIYGVNLHSVPGNPKRYRPNPNLFIFFIALGLALLKDKGKFCYIIPQTVLVNPDFDVIRYHMAKFLQIKQIITFKGKMFVSRGIKQERAVPTSSLIFLIEKTPPAKDHKVVVTNYRQIDDSIEESLDNIRQGRNVDEKSIYQQDLLENLSNWNFIKQSPLSIGLLKEYQKSSEDIEVYYEHSLAESEFGSRFYFDGGYSIDEKRLLSKLEDPKIMHYGFPKIEPNRWVITETNGYWPNIRRGKSKNVILLRQANQGYNLLDAKYKIIWSYNNTDRFLFSELPVIWARNKLLAIGSDNKEELCYLFAILNSKVTGFLLLNFVKIAQEDTRTILVSLQIVKDLIRVPTITNENSAVKKEIIEKTRQLLSLEERRLSDIVDFAGIMTQKFDEARIEGDQLVLVKDDIQIKRKVNTDLAMVKRHLELSDMSYGILLSDVRNIRITDTDLQQKLKEYIDDLVFSLYFGIRVERLDIKYSKELNATCRKNKFYELIDSSWQAVVKDKSES
jgi:hypothetical protein